MAVTVSAKNYTLIDNCEAVGNWVGESPVFITDFFKEGAGCLQFTVRGAGNQDTETTGNWNLSGVRHLRWWFMTVAFKELNWIQLYVSDGVDTGYYDVLSIADYPGGWHNIVIDLSRAVDAGTKPNMAAITTIGFRYNNSAIGKNSPNTWIDHLCLCDGLIAYGDDGGQPFDFADILAADENTANGWGIVRRISGIYYLVGSLEFGDSAGANSCDFKDVSQVIVFEDRKVNSNLYNFTAVGNAVGTTKFQLGDQADTAGVSGCVVRTQNLTQTAKYDVVCTDTDVSDFKLYGSGFLDADSISLPATGVNREVMSCSFEKCSEILANTCKVESCNIISAGDRGLRMSSVSHLVKNCTFISCLKAVHIDVAETYLFDALMFIGNTYDIENSTAGGDIYIDRTNGSNPDPAKLENSGTPPGTITINPLSVYLTVWVKDEANQPIENASVAIYKSADDSELMKELTLANGQAQESFQYTADTDIYIRIRKSSLGATRYYPLLTSGTIISTGYTLTAVLIEDKIVVA